MFWVSRSVATWRSGSRWIGPQIVRRLILVGTGPGGGEGILVRSPEVSKVAGRPELGLEEFNYLDLRQRIDATAD
jgi:hypothetical protein